VPRYIFLPDIDHFPVASEPSGDVAPSARVRWIVGMNGATAVATTAHQGECAIRDIPPSDKTIAVVPLARIAFIDALLPQVSAQKREQLLKFAIEDKLTIDPETVHAVVIGAALTGVNQYVVAAIDKRWLAAALNWLTSCGAAPQLAVAETALYAVGPGEWRVMLDHETGCAVRPDGHAYGIDYDSNDLTKPPFALTLALNEAAASANSQALPGRITLVAPTALTSNIDQARWQASLGEGGGAGIDLRIESMPNTVASMVVSAPEQQLAASNLLTGAFLPAGRSSAWLPAFKPALAIAAVALLIQLTAVSLEAWRVANQRRVLEGELKTLFLQSFPEATTVVDAPLQMSRNLQQLRRERGLGQDATLAQLALAASLTKSISEKIVNVSSRDSAVTITFAGISADDRPNLEAAAKSAGVSLTEDAGKALLTIRATESR
jgi:general secretion pathway protein L